MKNISNIKENLENVTFEHLKSKEFLKRTPEIDKKTKRETGKFHAPIENERIFLSIAFNMGFENYFTTYRNSDIKKFDNTNCPTELLKYIIKQNDKLSTDLINRNYDKLNEILKTEFKFFKFYEELRNYNSHFIHEPSVVKFDDLFDCKTHNKNKLNDDDMEEVKCFINEKLEQAKKHKLDTLHFNDKKLHEQLDALIRDENYTEEKNKELEKKIKQNNKVIERIKKFSLLNDKNELSFDSQLFISFMMLRKSQTDIILQKWAETKKKSGYYESLKKFYTYFSIRDAHSLTDINPKIFEFRKILGYISVFPEFPNQNLLPLYEFVKERNVKLFNRLNPIQIDLNKNRMKFNNPSTSAREKAIIEPKLKELNKEFDEISNKIIPLRKRNVITPTFLRFLINEGVIEGFEIACIKNNSEIIKNNDTRSLATIKEEMVKAKDESKKKLNEEYKEQKRNFKFIKTSELNDESLYCIKENAAILRMKMADGNYINVLFPNDLLCKLSFLRLKQNFDIMKVMEKIKLFITNYYNISKPVLNDDKININNIEKLRYNYNIDVLDYNKVFFKSFNESITNEESNKQFNENLTSLINKKLDFKINQLTEFVNLNKKQAKHWLYYSKKKIDLILNYTHFTYTLYAYKNNKTDDEIRHTCLNVLDYDTAYQYLRFFGREKDKPEFKEFFCSTHGIYFYNIAGEIQTAYSLENLFEMTIAKHIKTLIELKKDVNNNSQKALARVLGLKPKVNKETVEQYLRDSAYKSVTLSNDIVKLKDYFKDDINKKEHFKEIENNDNNKKEKKISLTDFSYIRAFYENKSIKTNTDFLLEVLLPLKSKTRNEAKTKLPNVYLRTFLKQKTYDLVLWHIAKKYWRDVNKGIPQTWDGINNDSKDFKKFNSFYDIYRNEIEIDLDKLKKKNKNEIENEEGNYIKVKISPHKMDDEFLMPEMQKRENQIKLRKIAKANNLIKLNEESVDFYKLYNCVKKELYYSFIDLGLILACEKIVLEKDINDSKQKMRTKYSDMADNSINDYFLDFIKGKSDNEETKHVLDEMIKQYPLNGFNFDAEDLKNYRNNALHYQLQDNDKIEVIRDYLEIIIKTKHNDYNRIKIMKQKKQKK